MAATMSPEDALATNGEYFTIVKNNPPVFDDFATHAERGIPLKSGGSPCQRCGLSVSRTSEEAVHIKKLFKKIGNYLVRGQLAAEHGCVKVTPGPVPNHTTWWPCEGVDRVSLFQVIQEI